jgi:hypothetical protein
VTALEKEMSPMKKSVRNAIARLFLADHRNTVRFSHTGPLTEDDKQRLETAISRRSVSREAGRKVSSGK